MVTDKLESKAHKRAKHQASPEPRANGHLPMSAPADDSGERGYGVECELVAVNGENIVKPIKLRTPHNPYPDERHEATLAELQLGIKKLEQLNELNQTEEAGNSAGK